MKSKKNWLIPLVVTIAAGAALLQNRLAAAPAPAGVEPVTVAASEVVTAEPPTTSAYPGCAYIWATHDAPELTEKFSSQVTAIAPNAKAHASLYGEDCVYADGHADFSVMETDFHVRLPVIDLANEESHGNWMAQVMQVVVNIPRGEVRGNYGFVEFWFEKGESEHIIARVPIQKYINEAQGKSGVELFKMFSNAP
jgi:hypothetical protein